MTEQPLEKRMVRTLDLRMAANKQMPKEKK
jgi:hypothetical protein